MINTIGTTEVKSFYDSTYEKQVSFPSNQIDAVVGFFLKRGYDEQAARSTSISLLNQARIDNINPFVLIDSLKGLDEVQLNQIVTKVLNTYRDKTSALGYKIVVTDETIESRNIRA
jgi:hypothetical protein